jgi:hypothetical protein
MYEAPSRGKSNIPTDFPWIKAAYDWLKDRQAEGGGPIGESFTE